MLIGSSYVRDMFFNSVRDNAHGLDVYLENAGNVFSLKTRHFSEISGKRFYEDMVEVARGNLTYCLSAANRLCVVDRLALMDANLLY